MVFTLQQSKISEKDQFVLKAHKKRDDNKDFTEWKSWKKDEIILKAHKIEKDDNEYFKEWKS